jgi:hypothetical protein
VRKLTGWKVVNSTQAAGSGAEIHQFSVKYLLVLTTICAIVLGFGRALASADDLNITQGRSMDWIDDLIAPVGMITLALFPAFVLPLILLSRHPASLVILLFPFVWLLLTWLAVETIEAMGGAPSKREVVEAVVGLQAGAALAGCASAIVLRLGGYRLASRAQR